MVQRLRIHLPLQGTPVQSLAAEPRPYTRQDNKVQEPQLLRAHTLQPPNHNKEPGTAIPRAPSKTRWGQVSVNVVYKKEKKQPQNRVKTIPPKLTSMHLCSWEVNRDTWGSKSYKKFRQGGKNQLQPPRAADTSQCWMIFYQAVPKAMQFHRLSLAVSKLSEAGTKDTRDSYIHCPLPSCSESNGTDRPVKHGMCVQWV